VVCLARRDPVDIAGPPRLSDVGARPLNFTVRGRNEARLCNESDKGEEPRQRPFV